MIDCRPDASWVSGRYKVVFSSAATEAEWKAFVLASPGAAKRAYERLSSEPMTRQPRRQFPLKGNRLKPFWEYEATGGTRIYYGVSIVEMTVIIAARADTHTGAAVAKLIKNRRAAFDEDIRALATSAAKIARATDARKTKRKPK